MSELNRRQVLVGLGTAAVGVGGYRWWNGDTCPDRRESEWTLSGERWSPTVTADGSVYVSEGYGITSEDRVSRVASLEQYDGEPNWVFTVSGGGAGVPLVADETVYVGTGADFVYALDQRTGRVEWRYDAGGRETYGGGAWGRPAKTDGLVLVGVSHSEEVDPTPSDDAAYTHRIVALDADTGEEVWAQAVDEMVWTGPIAVGDTVVAATRAGEVYGFAADDGTRCWRTGVGETVNQSIFADGDTVYVASEDGEIAAFATESGAERWTASLSGTVVAFSRDDGSLLVGTGAGSVVALSQDDGSERWRSAGEEGIAGLDSDGSVAYAVDYRGYVRVLDAETGERRDLFRVAEKRGEDLCGWSPTYERRVGLVAGDDKLFVSGPWVGQVPRRRE